MNQIPELKLLFQADRMGKDGDLLDVQRLLIYRRKGINQGRHGNLQTVKYVDPQDQVLKGLARFSLENGSFNSAIRFVKG